MTGGADDSNGGRVTIRELFNAQKEQTKELYAAIEAQNKERALSERRILDKLDDVGDSVIRQDERIKRNYEEVEKLRSRSNVNDIAVGIAAAITSAIAAAIGYRNG